MVGFCYGYVLNCCGYVYNCCGYVVPIYYLVSTQLQYWMFCCWGCGCCWAVTINFQHNLWLEFCQPQVSQYRVETFVFWVWLNLDSIMQFWVCGGILLRLCVELLRLCVELLRLCVPLLRLCGSQWLLSLNPTTISVVLLFWLWLSFFYGSGLILDFKTESKQSHYQPFHQS